MTFDTSALARTPIRNTTSQRVIGVLFDATEQSRAEQRLIMKQELRHRLKNMVHLAGIVARQTWRGAARLDTYLGRDRALAMSTDLMFGERGESLRLRDLIERSLIPFRSEGHDPFELSGPDTDLTDTLFTGIALVIHELATNAWKHEALSTPDGRVVLAWDVEEDLLSIEWRQLDGPPVRNPRRRGFGFNLLSRGALPPPHAVTLDFRPEGLVARITARLDV